MKYVRKEKRGRQTLKKIPLDVKNRADKAKKEPWKILNVEYVNVAVGDGYAEHEAEAHREDEPPLNDVGTRFIFYHGR